MISPHITVLNEERLPGITDAIYKFINGFEQLSKRFANQPDDDLLYHYTPIEKLFDILEGDSFWASRSRFSNDSTEDRVLGAEWISEKQYYGDNYVVCFCEDGDKLSQWRGYCPKGGASIGFKFEDSNIYTICKGNAIDAELLSGTKTDLYMNSALPVIYCKTDNLANDGVNISENFDKIWEEISRESKSIEMLDIVPYLKSSFFIEESEYRLVFDNTRGELEEYIQFRTLEDRTRMPYIVVRYGNLLTAGQVLKRTYTEKYIEDTFNEHINSHMRLPIIIPCGVDQGQVCRMFSNHMREHKKLISIKENIELQKRWEVNPQRILCDGHLPIVSITVSPSPQQEYIKEVIERFCRSRYWLQNVEVKCSKIPYVALNR